MIMSELSDIFQSIPLMCKYYFLPPPPSYFHSIDTIYSALAHGVSHLVGSIEVGKIADLVAWTPAFFGSKPDLILKGGIIVWGQMGIV